MNAFCIPPNQVPTMQQNKSKSCLLHALFGSAITTARIHTPSLLLLFVHDNPAIMTALNAQNLLLFFVQNNPEKQAS
jgi:hypothetical protein